MWDVLSWDQHPGGVDEGLQVDTWLCESVARVVWNVEAGRQRDRSGAE